MQRLIDALHADGYRVLGPVVGNGAIVHDELVSVDQLPAGRRARQAPGVYKLEPGRPGAWFDYAASPQSWKRCGFPPVARLWRSERKGRGFALVAESSTPERMALFGMRPCDIAAMQVMDRVLLEGPEPDPVYRRHREGALVVAVNCVEAGGTCFCASMGTGPRAVDGFDIALTEVAGPGRHYLVAEAATDRGAVLLGGLASRPASAEELEAADAGVAGAAAHMGRQVATDGLAQRLAQNVEHPQWELVGRRCLTCANCTMVCPTCFCSTVDDETDLSGAHASRVRRWDSCFHLDFSYIHGGSVRRSPSARYRQWLTHKFSSWVDQFGVFGCVGCGRCVTWCPVGIDVTEEIRSVAGANAAEAAGRPA